MRGFFSIGIVDGKSDTNIGTLWRSANIFDASSIFTVGRRYRTQSSDTLNTPKHVPLYEFATFEDFLRTRPYDTQLVGLETGEDGISLPAFRHPERCVYILGAEDRGLPGDVMDACHQIVRVPTSKNLCLNVASTGSIVMYDRYAKQI